MHSRPPGVSPLTLVLPHPPLPRRRSSLLSLKSNDSAPRTPRGVGSPVTSAIFCAPSRRSTDSWNSSNADDLEWEWKPDQVMLLSRTLDALPTHLVTPFNGPIPPANLLDKIARGVSDAKGPVEWPHSLRATRVKLIELSRLKAKEEAQAEQRRNVIAEEPEVEIADGESNYSYMHNNIEHPLEIGSRRPLYRQSSMDFMDPAGVELKNTASIARLSRRLQQRSDRVFSPYGRRSLQSQRRSTSPPPLKNMPSLISPSTQSSDTLDSLDSFSDPGAKRRSVSSMASSMSIISDRSTGVIPVPRVQRIRSDSVSMAAPPLPPKDRVKPTSALKRAPSYGAVAQEARKDCVTSPATRERRDSGSYPSSDEEEKIRTKHAKKQRTKSPPTPSKRSSSPTRQAGSATPPPVPEKDRLFIRGRGKGAARVQDENTPATSPKAKKAARPEGVKTSPKKRPNPMSLQRNPSIFGPELPKPAKAPVQEIPASPVRPRGGLLGLLSPSKRPRSPSPVGAPLSPLALSPAAPTVPDTPMSPSPKLKTLRRVKRLGPGRRISFGSMLGGGDDEGSSAMGDQRSCLGSAFQLI